jgi:RNA polymerase sigma factor (sigma-70 family)
MNPRLVHPSRLARSVLRTQSDERLTELAGTGSEAAFEALVARHRRSLVRHCAGVVGASDAEEAVQDALLRAHAALGRGTPVRQVAPWLHVIAHNSALNLLQARAARAECPPVADSESGAAEDHTAQIRVELGELVAAVTDLPSRQRDAIVMRELEGRSYAEIAQRLDATPGAVRQLINRARTGIRQRLAGLLPLDPVLRWALSAGGGGGARVGALSDACVATIKVCAALVPAASLSIGGLSLIDHGSRTSTVRPLSARVGSRSARVGSRSARVRPRSAGVGSRSAPAAVQRSVTPGAASPVPASLEVSAAASAAQPAVLRTPVAPSPTPTSTSRTASSPAAPVRFVGVTRGAGVTAGRARGAPGGSTPRFRGSGDGGGRQPSPASASGANANSCPPAASAHGQPAPTTSTEPATRQRARRPTASGSA